MMNSKRTILYISLVIISLIISLAFTYAYGSFQHSRYWKGTIKKVTDIEIEMIKGFLPVLNKLDNQQLRAVNYNDLFDGLKGKLSISVILNGQLAYTNSLKERIIDKQASEFGNKKVIIKINRYQPPKWAYNYKSWITNITAWNTPRFDYITVPFLTSLLSISLFLYALLWRYRSNYLSNDVRKLLANSGYRTS